jgi:PhzF family phenazine biosynthesis protein
MTRLPIYQVDAFTDHLFGGNPAGVVLLREWLPEPTMQAIAAENNVPATAFVHKGPEGYALRWFTPSRELPLCGHGTLASAHIVLNRLEPSLDKIVFRTPAGLLTVTRHGKELAMELPAKPAAACAVPPGLAAALGTAPRAVLASTNYLAVFDDCDDIVGMAPDFAALRQLDRGVIVTAPGRDGIDCVSRYFAPTLGIDEDPVTGSAHCILVPYWAERLGKTRLRARQASSRGGLLSCEMRGASVVLAGHATLYLEGTITV